MVGTMPISIVIRVNNNILMRASTTIASLALATITKIKRKGKIPKVICQDIAKDYNVRFTLKHYC
jgi:hypothetical protein